MSTSVSPAPFTITRANAIGLRVSIKDLPGHVRPETVWRWVRLGILRDGVRVKLYAVRLGVRWFTCTEAIAEFVRALNAAPEPEATQPTPAQRRTAADRDHAKLAEELGTA